MNRPTRTVRPAHRSVVQSTGHGADPFRLIPGYGAPAAWSLDGLDPTPESEWLRLRTFLGLGAEDMDAMLATVEPLFRRGHELVVGTYDYLLQNPETAAILGWEGGVEATHLEERRRFFTLWLARLIGMDLSDDFARYLFRAGKLHAAHGQRHTHVPPVYVTGSISLMNAGFARLLYEEMAGDPVVPRALAGWNKVLSLHLHLMQMGYSAALAVDTGEMPIKFTMFGRMRTVTGLHDLVIRVPAGSTIAVALRKYFNYVPVARAEVFDIEWQAGEHDDAHGTPWLTVNPVYRVKANYRVLHNGHDLNYGPGTGKVLQQDDEIHIFPPGR